MKMKAVILSTARTVVAFVEKLCVKNNVQASITEDPAGLVELMRETKPDMVFCQISDVENLSEPLVSIIKSDQVLGDTFIIIFGSRPEGAGFADQVGADAFLPVPFTSYHLNAVLRSIFSLPREVVLCGKAVAEDSSLAESLEKKGYANTYLEGGSNTADYVLKRCPDLVILAEELEGQKGVDCCRAIKQDPLAANIPVILLSGSSEASFIESCFENGAQTVLLAPFDSEANLQVISQIAEPPRKGRKQKAVVVDDSAIVRNLITKMFRQLGYVVYTAENGQLGLEAARQFQPDILVTDYDMPVMNGWELCTELKHDSSVSEIPVIMVTARSSEVDKKKGQVLGVASYLTKPFKTDDLKQSVAEAIANKRQKDEKSHISKYVAADALQSVSDLVEGLKDAEPEEKFISVLFTDIVSFSRKCERMEPIEIVNLLNKYLDNMVTVLGRHNAIIDKFIGDAIVARFDSGNPEEDAFNAASAALDMLGVLELFNKKAKEKIEIRIGINSGVVILGNIGSTQYRLDYTMIGDNVNIGQRLESEAPPMGCYISDSTCDLIKDRVKTGKPVELAVKGKKETVKAYHLREVSAKA